MSSYNAITGKKRPVLMQVLPALNSGGVERGTIDIALAAAKTGYTSIVVSEGGKLEQWIKGENIHHIKLPLSSKNPINIYKNINRLAKIIQQYDVDIVHARSRGPAWSAYFAASQEAVKFVTTFHGTYNFDNNLKHKYNAIMTKGQCIIAVSNFIADHINNNYQVDSNKIRVIHRGVDLDHFNPDSVSPSRLISLAHSWRIPEDRPIIMLPGRLTRWKGQAFLLEALSKIPKDLFYCIFVGDNQGYHTEYTEELGALIKEYNLEGAVHFAGSTQDMPAAYMLADVVVSPSLEPEAFGRVATEAQAMGRLLITTNHGGAKETVRDNETGWLIEAGNALQLSQALRHALSLSDAQRKEMGHVARSHIQQHFNLEQMVEKTLSVYEELLVPAVAEFA